MSEPLQKDYSIVLRVERIPGWNRDLEELPDTEAQGRIRQTYVEKYGSGAGNLEVVKKKSKIKLSWFPPKLSFQAEELHHAALAEAKGRNYSEAVNNWVKAISINSSDPEYYFNLGVAFFELKNHKESIENLRKAVQVCPIYYKAHLVLGTVYIKERKFEEAEQHLLETINFNPNVAFAYLNLGAVYSILKRYAEGIEMFEKSLALAPNQVKALFGLGKIYSITGDLEVANKYFKKVVELDPKGLLAGHAKRAMVSAPFDKPISSTASDADPKDIEHLYQAGYRAYLFTDYDRSIKMYNEYLAKKDDDDFVWFSLGECYLRIGSVEKAIDSYQKAIALNSTKALYFKSLAIAQNYLNQEDEVIKSLSRAKQLGKNDSLTHTLWGKVLIRQQNFEEAIDNLSDAIRQNPNNLLAKYYLAIAFQKTNHVNSALNCLEEIASSPIDSPLKSEAIKLKTELRR